jgi:hypothetical protein
MRDRLGAASGPGAFFLYVRNQDIRINSESKLQQRSAAASGPLQHFSIQLRVSFKPFFRAVFENICQFSSLTCKQYFDYFGGRSALMKYVIRRSEQEYSGPQIGDCILYHCEGCKRMRRWQLKTTTLNDPAITSTVEPP